MVEPAGLSQRVRAYLELVVNKRDTGAVDQLVAADYRGSGHGWPRDLAALRAFYEHQAAARPDWRIDVQQTIELDDVVVVHALAGGSVVADEQGAPLEIPLTKAVEWLAAYRFADGVITEVQVLALRERSTGGTPPCSTRL